MNSCEYAITFLSFQVPQSPHSVYINTISTFICSQWISFTTTIHSTNKPLVQSCQVRLQFPHPSRNTRILYKSLESRHGWWGVSNWEWKLVSAKQKQQTFFVVATNTTIYPRLADTSGRCYETASSSRSSKFAVHDGLRTRISTRGMEPTFFIVISPHLIYWIWLDKTEQSEFMLIFAKVD